MIRTSEALVLMSISFNSHFNISTTIGLYIETLLGFELRALEDGGGRTTSTAQARTCSIFMSGWGQAAGHGGGVAGDVFGRLGGLFGRPLRELLLCLGPREEGRLGTIDRGSPGLSGHS